MAAIASGKLIKQGGSLTLLIPAPVRKAAGLTEAQTVIVEAEPGGFRVRTRRPRYSLAELLARSTRRGVRSAGEDRAFLDAPAVGRERW